MRRISELSKAEETYWVLPVLTGLMVAGALVGLALLMLTKLGLPAWVWYSTGAGVVTALVLATIGVDIRRMRRERGGESEYSI
jgi:hypothetical protein